MVAASLKITLPNEKITFDQIHTAFANSSHGKFLNQAVRYGRYQEVAGLAKEAWVALLGPDVNNLEHMTFTDGLTITFLNSCSQAVKKGNHNDAITFSPDEAVKLRLTARIHDWGESIKGHYDITFADKTIQDEEAEHKALQRILRSKTRAVVTNKEDENALVRLMRTALKEIATDRTTKLGKAFNAIERLGYLSTGIKAFEVRPIQEKKVSEGLAWLTTDVFLNQIEMLCSYKVSYPPVEEFLQHHKITISDAFNDLPEEVFKYYPAEKRDSMKNRFTQVRKVWFASF
ncbi:MAG: hypothetical protein ACR2LN_05775 [Candidatus Levyibacteriota bacterium]